MIDLAMLILLALAFAAAVGLVKVCERLSSPRSDTP